MLNSLIENLKRLQEKIDDGFKIEKLIATVENGKEEIEMDIWIRPNYSTEFIKITYNFTGLDISDRHSIG